MTLRKVGNLDLVWQGEKAGVVVQGRAVLLVNVEGEICAYEDRCRHKGVKLSEGRLDGAVLTCAAHGWQYDARTGRGINPEGIELPRYVVKVEGNDVFVDLPEGADRGS
jgi:toluene monooxygenase system ferredoxin subunit